MKRYIRSANTAQLSYFRTVPKGADPLKFEPYELGIHCGTYAQAEYICETKYHGNCDIYELTLKSSVQASNVMSDFDAWNSVEAVAEILSDGFDVDIDRDDVVAAYRSGEFSKDNAAEYIKSVVGATNLVVCYDNAVEVAETDIIILDKDCIEAINRL